MPHRCSYFQCINTAVNKSMFRFPTKNPELVKLWLENCGNMTIDHLPLRNLRYRFICIDHFDVRYIRNETGQRKRILRGAVPEPYNGQSLEKAATANNSETSLEKVPGKEQVLQTDNSLSNNLEIIKNNIKDIIEKNKQDEDLYFCLSLVKEIKKVVEDRRLKLKIDIYNLIEWYQSEDSKIFDDPNCPSTSKSLHQKINHNVPSDKSHENTPSNTMEYSDDEYSVPDSPVDESAACINSDNGQQPDDAGQEDENMCELRTEVLDEEEQIQQGDEDMFELKTEMVIEDEGIEFRQNNEPEDFQDTRLKPVQNTYSRIKAKPASSEVHNSSTTDEVTTEPPEEEHVGLLELSSDSDELPLKRPNTSIIQEQLTESLESKHSHIPEETSTSVKVAPWLRKDIYHSPRIHNNNNRKHCVICLRKGVKMKVASSCVACEEYLCFGDCWTDWHSREILPGKDNRRKRPIKENATCITTDNGQNSDKAGAGYRSDNALDKDTRFKPVQNTYTRRKAKPASSEVHNASTTDEVKTEPPDDTHMNPIDETQDVVKTETADPILFK